jgi:hypothetical protein
LPLLHACASFRKTMNKTELIERIAKEAEVPTSEAQRHFEAFERVVTEMLKGGQDNGLRQVLRQGAQGQGGKEPPDRPEDEDRGF